MRHSFSPFRSQRTRCRHQLPCHAGCVMDVSPEAAPRWTFVETRALRRSPIGARRALARSSHGHAVTSRVDASRIPTEVRTCQGTSAVKVARAGGSRTRAASRTTTSRAVDASAARAVFCVPPLAPKEPVARRARPALRVLVPPSARVRRRERRRIVHHGSRVRSSPYVPHLDVGLRVAREAETTNFFGRKRRQEMPDADRRRRGARATSASCVPCARWRGGTVVAV
jgi:hypothetical protein